MPTTTRAAAAQYLDQKLNHLSKEARQSASDDTAAGYGPDIDEALRRMAVEDTTVLTTFPQIMAFFTLCKFYALERIAALIATRVDTEGYAQEGDRNTIFDHVVALRNAAAKECALYGYLVEATDDSQIGAGNQPPPTEEDGVTTAWSRKVMPTDYTEVYPYPLDL